MKENLLKSFVDAMQESADIVRQEDPDYLVAPMMGSVPLVDVMAVVSNDFDPSRVVYMPASSRIDDVSRVIRKWYSNFLNAVVGDVLDAPPKIMGIDEVVSGNSVLRCFKPIDLATESYRKDARQNFLEDLCKDPQTAGAVLRKLDMATNNEYFERLRKIKSRIEESFYLGNPIESRNDRKFLGETMKTYLENILNYKTIGVEDSKKKGDRNLTYEMAKKEGRVFPVNVETILTMDKPSYCSAQFRRLANPRGKPNYVLFSPEVDSFEVSGDYVRFLADLARYVGKSASQVAPVNMSAILDSSKYLG